MDLLALKRSLMPMSGPQDMGGGGGGGSSTGTQTTISELPEWARGYAKSTLEKGAAITERPYQAYDAPRIAGFSPMQLQAQQGAAEMQTSGLTGLGGQVAGEAAMRGLGQNYDAGQFYGGRFGGRQAAQYMSPYIQEALAPQLREAQRSSDIMGQQNAARAVGQGAFGGSRSGLVEAERQRNLATQMGDIRAKGLQDAYTQAASQYNADQQRAMQAQQLGEQSRQFGANLGLQGLQTALTGAGQLGALGGQQFQQGMDINKLQSAYGGQQQALRQQGLTQAYEDFQNQQNYPYKQLGFMSDLIRGLPLGQQSSRSIYEPTPGMAQQIGSIGLGAYGLSKFMADGGMAYADGGEVQGYAGDDGSLVGDVDSKDKLSEYAHRIKTDADLQKAGQMAKARGDLDQLEAVENEMALRASLRRGIAGGITNQMAERMAGGGVVAFAQGGINATLSKLDTLGETDISETPEQREAGITAAMPGVEKRYGPSITAPYLEDVKKERAGLSKMSDEGVGLGALAASQALLRPGSASRAVAGAMGAFGQEVVKMKKEQREADRLLRQSEITLATAEQARKDGLTGKAEAMYDKSQTQKKEALDRQIGVQEKKATIEGGLEQARISAAASAAAHQNTDFKQLANSIYAAKVEAGAPATAATRAAANKEAADQWGKYPGTARTEAAEQTARDKAEKATQTFLSSAPGIETAKQIRALSKTDPAAATKMYEDLVLSRMPKSASDKQTGPAPAQPTTQQAPAQPTIKPGQVMEGYRFKGGNPADKANWEKV